jgi:zinc transport system substrate-binding protein
MISDIFVIFMFFANWIRERKMKFVSTAVLAAAFIFICGCSPEKDSGKIKVAAGIPPVAGLATAIGGERIEVISVLPQGRTPHDFTPRNQTVRQTAGSRIFLTTGMPFENKVADFVRKNGIVCDVSDGIERIAFHDGSNSGHSHHDGCSHDEHDPHVWLTPANAVKIAKNICDALCQTDPQGKEVYLKNFGALKDKLEQLDREIKDKLSVYPGKTFFVYHPAFGYFADAYGLQQRAIELNGREASPKQLANIISEAKASGVSTIFVQEQFNPRSAQALAEQINGQVIPLDPLAENVPENLKKIADAIAGGFKGEKR